MNLTFVKCKKINFTEKKRIFTMVEEGMKKCLKVKEEIEKIR